MAVNENVNKVVYGNSTLIDLTNDTVVPEALVDGYTAHDRSGATVTGTLELPSSSNPLPVEKGGTNANTASGARTNLDVYSKSEVANAIAQSTANMFKAKYWTYEPSTGATAGTFIEMATKADLGLTGKTIRGIAVEEVYGGADVDYNAKVVFNARAQKFVLMPSITQTPIRAHFTVFYSD